MHMNDYYVYVIFDEAGVPRYVGASGSNRVETWTCPSNWKWGFNPVCEWLKSIGGPPEIRKIITGLTFAQVNVWETQLIDFIGRQCDGTGPLLNVQLGGLSKDLEAIRQGKPKKPPLGPRVTRKGLVVSQWTGPLIQKSPYSE